MKPSPKFLLAVLTVALLVGTAVFFMTGEPAKSAASSSKQTTRSTERVNELPQSSTQSAPATVSQPAATAATTQEEILAVIEEAAVSYSAEELPKIQPYLLSLDPEIRAAALDGMITLGDAAAGPLLRAASQFAPSPEEASALREAADYVELPSGSLLKK